MSLISRLTTWTVGQILKSADLNNEFNNITNLVNNLDSATTSWTNVKTSTLTPTQVTKSFSFNPTTLGIIGTTTNDAATAGNTGEYVESVVGSVSNGSTGNWSDITSISLTAGDWDVTGIINHQANGATITQARMGISATSGNSTTGLVDGSNSTDLPIAVNGVRFAGGAIPSYRVSIATTTTYYLKMNCVYSVATPQTLGARISARRIR